MAQQKKDMAFQVKMIHQILIMSADESVIEIVIPHSESQLVSATY